MAKANEFDFQLSEQLFLSLQRLFFILFFFLKYAQI